MLTVHAIARRGVEAAYVIARSEPPEGKPHERQVPVLGALVFLLLCFAFILAMAAILYTYGHVIATLCMIESSSSQTYLPIDAVSGDEPPPAYDVDGTPKPPSDAEINVVRTQPITNSFRATLAHLRQRAGFWSRFRGLSSFIVWSAASGFVVALLSQFSKNTFSLILFAVVAQVAVSNLILTWIHVVISEPSTKRWYQRIPRPVGAAWRKMAPSVALWALASQIAAIFPLLVAGSFGVAHRFKDPAYRPGTRDAYATAGQFFLVMFLSVLLHVLLQIPATVAMVRVAASMLPEEDETIVPFDRTFGGLTTPEIIGGQGKIGIVEAWRSFNWECRRRLLRMVVKFAALVIAAWLAFTVVIMIQGHVMMGPAFGDLLKRLHGMHH